MRDQEPNEQQDDTEAHGFRYPRKTQTPSEGVEQPQEEKEGERPA